MVIIAEAKNTESASEETYLGPRSGSLIGRDWQEPLSVCDVRVGNMVEC